MKKIVALVLSLVMVLGLATTAFGAVTVKTENIDVEDWVATYFADNTKVVFVEGDELLKTTFADYSETVNGETTNYYGVTVYEGIEVDGTDYAAVEVAKAAANAQFETETGKVIYVYVFEAEYLDDVDFYAEDVASAYTAPNLSGDCGTCATGYYTVGVMKYAPYSTEALPTLAVYKDEIVLLGAEATIVPHTCLDDDGTDCKWNVKDNKVVSVTCECDETYKVVQSIKGLKTGTYAPVAYKADADSTTEVNYVVFVETVADTDADTTTEKVTSAETFDAGIAMYVGMSVMAAAGSAVVLKKKD